MLSPFARSFFQYPPSLFSFFYLSHPVWSHIFKHYTTPNATCGRVLKKARHLGVFSSEEEAARVYDRNVLASQGLKNKGLNFADSEYLSMYLSCCWFICLQGARRLCQWPLSVSVAGCRRSRESMGSVVCITLQHRMLGRGACSTTLYRRVYVCAAYKPLSLNVTQRHALWPIINRC